MPFSATWKDLEIITLSEVKQKKTNIIWYHLYIESKIIDTDELTYKTDSQAQRTNLWLPERKRSGKGEMGSGEGQLGSVGLTCPHCCIQI